MRGFVELVRRFRDDERGVFAVFFGLFAIVLIATAGAVVDFTSIELARTKAQQALDSAALGLARKIYDQGVTADTLKTQAKDLVVERVGDASIAVDVTEADVDKPNGRLRLTGSITVPMAFVRLVGINTMSATVVSEATKGSINLEVAVALDNTGSMKNYIEDLKSALNSLIEMVVNDVQQPTYSKMAIAPYAASVDGGKYVNTLRGTPPAAKSITSVAWWEQMADINDITQARPPKVTTATNHGYLNGDVIYISGVRGMTELNGNFYKVAGKTNTTFTLQTLNGTNVDARNYDAYRTTSNDKIRKCIVTSCEIVVTTSGDHGFATNDVVRLTDVNSSWNKSWTVTKQNNTRFSLDGSSSTSTGSNPMYSSGNAWCTEYGCEYYYFRRASGGYTTYQITGCVTERATNTYTDAAPSTTLLGANYTSDGRCDSGFSGPIVPLTSDKSKLYAASDKMDDYGSTAGHLGTAWAWYLVAPSFGYVWNDSKAVPAAYNAENLLKVVILMTDGDYNEQYCNGVKENSIDCSAPASSTSQARSLCANMNAKTNGVSKTGIVVYTVGFNISKGSSAATTLEQCASDSSKALLAKDGAALIEAFRYIGQNITDLRLSL